MDGSLLDGAAPWGLSNTFRTTWAFHSVMVFHSREDDRPRFKTILDGVGFDSCMAVRSGSRHIDGTERPNPSCVGKQRQGCLKIIRRAVVGILRGCSAERIMAGACKTPSATHAPAQAQTLRSPLPWECGDYPFYLCPFRVNRLATKRISKACISHGNNNRSLRAHSSMEQRRIFSYKGDFHPSNPSAGVIWIADPYAHRCWCEAME